MHPYFLQFSQYLFCYLLYDKFELKFSKSEIWFDKLKFERCSAHQNNNNRSNDTESQNVLKFIMPNMNNSCRKQNIFNFFNEDHVQIKNKMHAKQ